MKKAISILLAVVIAISVIVPGLTGLDFATTLKAEAAAADEAYATVFTASDFQANDYVRNLNNLISSIRDGGVTETPDAFLFGGDYYDSGSASDSTTHIGLMTREINEFYPYYDRNNLVYIQGNHDLITKDIAESGLHYYDDFIVYVANFNDYTSGSSSSAQALASKLTLAFDRLIADGEDRPVFVMTHMPLHHNSRGSYLQNAYAKYIVDVLNDYGVYLDIIFMFGHNHSGNYDDYIGGSINYIGKGETMYVSPTDTYGEDAYVPVELNFTYMNYGYGGYSNNTDGTVTDPHTGNTVTSSNAVTMGVLKIYPDKITVSRFYETGGQYPVTKTIERITPTNEDGSYDEPYVNVAGYTGGNVGVQTGAYANANGFGENAVYSWTSSNSSVATVNGTGSVAQVAYKSVGTSVITVTVTEGSVSRSASYTVTVDAAVSGTPYINIRLGTSDVTNMTLEYYNTELPHIVNLIGCYANTTSAVSNESWTTSDANIATVENGFVKFIKSGTVTITYSVVHNGSTLSASTTFIVSDGSPIVESDEIVGYKDKYYLSNGFVAGNRYIILAIDNGGDSISSPKMLSGTKNGTVGTDGSAKLAAINQTPSTDSKGDYIETTDSNVVWVAEKAPSSNCVYLKNLSTGEYLVLAYQIVGGTSRCRTATTAALNDGRFNSNAYQIYYHNSNYVRSKEQESGNNLGSKSEYLRYNTYFLCSTAASKIQLYQAETILAEPETETHIEMSGANVEGTTQTVYSVSSGEKINLYPRYQNYGSGVIDSWSSSNASVASINDDGVVTLTGAGGSTEISYTIKSDAVSEQTVTFTLETKTADEKNRVFKYVDKITDGKKYVMIYRDKVSEGDGNIISTIALGPDKLYSEDIEVKKNYVNDYLYVEIPESTATDRVFVSTSGPTASETASDINDDTFYFCTEETTPNGITEESRFIGAQITGHGEWGVTGELFSILFGDVDMNDEEGLKYYQFAYNAPGLYNRIYADVSYTDDNGDVSSYAGYTGIGYHSSNYFGIASVKNSKMMLFEEIDPEPTAVIMSNYKYVGTETSRENVCPDQTEQLTGKAENFPDGTKTVTWSSSNTEVATIDSNGKITYTGKPGTTTITLTITVTNDVEGTVTDTQTVDIYVNPSQATSNNIYYQTDALVPGNDYVLAHTYADDGNVYTFSNTVYGDTSFSKADTENTIVSGTTNYIQDPTTTSVWTCVDSGVDGYVYLVDQNGWYLAIDYTSNPRICRSYESLSDLENSELFLIYYSGGKLRSKGGGGGGISFNKGTTTPRFQVSSTMATFELFAKGREIKSNTYYLTDSFVDGKKYVLSNRNTENELALALGNVDYNRSSGATNKHAVNEPVAVLGTDTFIQTPAEKTVWECIASSESGYFYLKSIEDGRYLVANYSATVTENKLTSAATLDEFGNTDAYLFEYRKSSDGTMVLNSKQMRSLNAYIVAEDWGNGSGAFGTSTGKKAMYLYALDEEEVDLTEPVTQIRVNGRTTSKDVTNTVSNRYNIKNGDTDKFLRYVVNVNDGYTYEWTSSDTSVATIDNNGNVTYTGKEGYATFTLKVTGTDFGGNDYSKSVSTTVQTFSGGYVLSNNDYPEYPYEGSVRVNKTASNNAGGTAFQESGVTEIELGVTGVPVDQPVDVVIVFDHSTSMNDGTMLIDAMEDTQDFALQILDDNVNNRVAIVAFDSMCERYESIDSTKIKNSLNESESGIITGDGSVANALISSVQEEEMVESIEKMITNVQGNTNYDYGFKYAYDILKNAKESGSQNNPVVVFMSDGEPNQFNHVQLETSTGTMTHWLTGDKQYFIDNGYLNADGSVKSTYPAMAYFNENGDNWYAQAIKTPAGEPANLPSDNRYSAYQEGIGASLFTIGYKMTDTYGLLSRMASSSANYYHASDNLQAAYSAILNQILQSANNAVVTDKMGDHFDVQFATSYTIGEETITLNPIPKFEIGNWILDNTGNRVSYNVIETITFTTNANGVLTGAESSVIGECYDTNSSTINGRYVSYNLNTETFTWNVGEINRTELTLKYYACLEGAATGEREAGTFATNEYATLTYTNYRGTVGCTKAFPVPTLAWDQASVSYDFYLVNANGQPVNLSGVVVPFSERVTIGREQTKQILLNNDGEVTYSLIASEELPEGYELYNPDAYYTVNVSSISANSYATIYDDTLTTYFRDGSNAINVNGNVNGATGYTNTAVSFAVKTSQGVIPDSVVIDYGLPVKISVLGNDYVVDGGSLTGVAKSVANGTELNNVSYTSSKLTNGGTEDVAMTYGKATIDGEYIIYTPTRTDMGAEEVFYYEYNAGGKYYYTTVTVIPAANIYYEETFMTFIDGQDDYKWVDAGESITDKFQAEDRPGTFAFDIFDADNAYGDDPAYNDSYTYSLGNAKKTTVDAAAFGKEAKATFTFCGTGFDLFSVTNSDTGAVQVTIYNAGTTTIYKNFLVNTYYGYSYDENGNLLPGSSSTLYQVPVVSRRDLAYGTYDVVIKPLYSSAFDPNYSSTADRKDNNYSIYVDSVRIFNPAGAGNISNKVIKDAYYKDGEYAPVFMEIRDTIISAETFNENIVNGLNLGYTGSIFLDGKASNSGETALATYKNQGPKNELYLAKGQAVAFNLSSADKEALASLQLGMKVVSGSSEAEVTIMNTGEKYPNSITLNSTHETFKKLNSAIIWNNKNITYGEDNKYETVNPIVIANTSDEATVISLTSFKWAHTTKPETGDAEPAVVDFMVYDSTPAYATMALRRAMTVSEEPEESKTYNEEDISMEWSDGSFVEGKEATLKVTTPPEVVKVTVGGIEIDKCEIDENGNKLWTYTFVVQQAGENVYEVIFYDYNGDASEPVMTETIIVEEAPDEPTTDEPTTDEPTTDEPTTDEPTTDEPTTDEPETDEPSTDEPVTEPSTDDSAFDKVMQVLSDVFNKVFSFLKSIIEFFWRLF